jgi:hypothetical protein
MKSLKNFDWYFWLMMLSLASVLSYAAFEQLSPPHDEVYFLDGF